MIRSKVFASAALALSLILSGIPVASAADIFSYQLSDVIGKTQETPQGYEEPQTVWLIAPGTTLTVRQSEAFNGNIAEIFILGDDDTQAFFYAPTDMPETKVPAMDPLTITFGRGTDVHGEPYDLGKPGLYNLGFWVLDLAPDSGFYNVYADALFRVVDENDVTATPTASPVLVDGKSVSFDAYTINQNNYFKLRDLAKVLSGSPKQFAVEWDAGNRAINIRTNRAYTTVGGELLPGSGQKAAATPSTAKLFLDGKSVSLTAYTIGGNNYMKLRELGKLLDFGVGWNGASSTITIDTAAGYTAA